jgi:serpin B
MKMLSAAALSLLLFLPAPPPASAQDGGAAPPDTASATKIAQADNAFGFALLAMLHPADGAQNLFFSPVSLAQALALAYHGAAGTTQQAIGHGLQLDAMTPDQVGAANASLLQSLADPEKTEDAQAAQDAGLKVQLEIANALWANKGVTFNPDYVQRLQRDYSADAATLDFHDPAAAATINDWTGKHTGGKITEIVSSGDVASAEMVLTNAVYFQGRWSHAFRASSTQPGAFTHADGTSKSLPMMAQVETARYWEDDTLQAVALPYGRGRLSLYVILPKKADGLAALLTGLDAAKWEHWTTGLAARPVDLLLPRFNADYENDVAPSLKALGMAAAFGPGADFTPMGLPGLFISQVRHKAVLRVNEQGTEAAAATAVMMPRGMRLRPDAPVTMHVDHPFLCAIRDDTTGALLFLGAISDPVAGDAPPADH